MTDVTPPASGWWSKLLSGSDNTTPAIGRVLGALLFVNLLTILPAVVVGVLLTQGVRWDVWSAVFMALVAYVPSIVGSITVLIRVTNSTEPKGGL